MERKYDLKTLLSVLKTDTIELIHTKIELLKLETVEKISRTGSLLIYGLIIMNLLFFALLFAFIAFGFLIGDWLQSIAAGFAIVTSIYIVILVILLSCRKSILTKIQNMFLKEL
jgi:hypothetical protein